MSDGVFMKASPCIWVNGVNGCPWEREPRLTGPPFSPAGPGGPWGPLRPVRPMAPPGPAGPLSPWEPCDGRPEEGSSGRNEGWQETL